MLTTLLPPTSGRASVQGHDVVSERPAVRAAIGTVSQAVTTDVKGSPLGRHFPYTVNGGEDKPGEEYYKAFQYTPFASEYLADFAKAAIEGSISNRSSKMS